MALVPWLSRLIRARPIKVTGNGRAASLGVQHGPHDVTHPSGGKRRASAADPHRRRSPNLLVAAKVSRDPARTAGILDAGMVIPASSQANSRLTRSRSRRVSGAPAAARRQSSAQSENPPLPAPVPGGLIQHPHRGLGAIREHGDSRLRGSGPRARIPKALCLRFPPVGLGPARRSIPSAGTVVLRDESAHRLG
jgi:hypothetical protein